MFHGGTLPFIGWSVPSSHRGPRASLCLLGHPSLQKPFSSKSFLSLLLPLFASPSMYFGLIQMIDAQIYCSGAGAASVRWTEQRGWTGIHHCWCCYGGHNQTCNQTCCRVPSFWGNQSFFFSLSLSRKSVGYWYINVSEPAEKPSSLGNPSGGLGCELCGWICAQHWGWIHCHCAEEQENCSRRWDRNQQRFQKWWSWQGSTHHRQPNIQEEETPLQVKDQSHRRVTSRNRF